MTDSIRVRSRAHMPFRAVEPHPDPEKPGNSPPLRFAIVKPGVNTLAGDEAAAYRAWAGSKPSLVADGVVAEMTEDEPEVSYGFEPALAAASNEGISAGSTIQAAGPVSSADMKPTSVVPNDDSPRSQTRNPATPPGAPASASPNPAPAPAPAPAKASTPAAKQA